MALLTERIRKSWGELVPYAAEMPCSYHHSHLLLTLVSRTSHFRVIVNLDDLEPTGVRASSLICLVGLGLGLGSLLIYRICSRIFNDIPPSPRNNEELPPELTNGTTPHTGTPASLSNGSASLTSTPASLSNGSASLTSTPASLHLQNTDDKQDSPAQTPCSDSGISTSSSLHSNMGADLSMPDQAVHYNAEDGVRFRRRFVHELSAATSQQHANTDLSQQLHINIPESDDPPGCDDPSGVTVSPDAELGDTFSHAGRRTSEDQISLRPNYSPKSLFEKNMQCEHSPGGETSDSPGGNFHETLAESGTSQTVYNPRNSASYGSMDNSPTGTTMPDSTNNGGSLTDPLGVMDPLGVLQIGGDPLGVLQTIQTPSSSMYYSCIEESRDANVDPSECPLADSEISMYNSCTQSTNKSHICL